MAVPENSLPVVGYEGLYLIQQDGQVWALPKASRSEGRFLKQAMMRHGYSYVSLFKDGKTTKHYTHRIVAIAFLGDRPGMQVNHIDGNKKNNHLTNLEWCTAKENKQHAWATGLTSIDERKTRILSQARELLVRGPKGRYIKNIS